MQRISKGAIAIILLLIIALLGVGAVGYLSKGFQNWSYKEWFSKDIKDPIIDTGKDSNKSSALVTDGNGNELVSGVVYDLPSAIVFNGVTGKKTNTALYSDDDVSTVADEDGGILLQAIIKPDYAIDKSVDWTINWVDSNDSWAKGKNIADYLTVTPNSDGSTIAKLYCTERFGAQAQITVTSRRNPNATRSCKVDMQRSCDGEMLFIDTAANSFDSSYFSTFLSDNEPTVTLDFNKLYAINYNAYMSTGSIGNSSFDRRNFMTFYDPDLVSPSNSYSLMYLSYDLKLSNDVYDYLSTKFTPVKANTSDYTFSLPYIKQITIGNTTPQNLLKLTDSSGKNSISLSVLVKLQELFFTTASNDNIVSLVEALKLYDGEMLKFSYRSNYSGYEDIYNQTISIKFDPSTITLDPTDIEFPDIVLP